jgi:hypothetical protein
MSKYFAKVVEGDVVSDVIVAGSYEWVAANLDGEWIETSLDGSVRANFAGVGNLYDRENDVFYPTKDNKAWLMDESTWQWVPPTPMPEAPEGDLYFWCNQEDRWKLESEVAPLP